MVKPQTFNIEWTLTAQKDLLTVVDYIAQQSFAEAESILERLCQTANNLNTLPFRGRLVPELSCYGIRSFRELLLPPWRIIYQITDNSIFIHAVLDGRRNLEDILLERFLN